MLYTILLYIYTLSLLHINVWKHFSQFTPFYKNTSSKLYWFFLKKKKSEIVQDITLYHYHEINFVLPC